MEQKKNERSGVVKTGAEKGGRRGKQWSVVPLPHFSTSLYWDRADCGGIERWRVGGAVARQGKPDSGDEHNLDSIIVTSPDHASKCSQVPQPLLQSVGEPDYSKCHIDGTIGSTTVSGLFHILTLPFNSTLKL